MSMQAACLQSPFDLRLRQKSVPSAAACLQSQEAYLSAEASFFAASWLGLQCCCAKLPFKGAALVPALGCAGAEGGRLIIGCALCEAMAAPKGE